MRRLALLVFALTIPVFADLVIVNSHDWRFVLLAMEYAHYQGEDIIFLLTESQSDIVAKNLAGEGFVVFEDSDPVVKDYDRYLRNFYDIESEKKSFKDYRELQEYILRVLSPGSLYIASTVEPENTLISIPIAYKEDGLVLFRSSSLFSRLGDFEDITIVGNIERDYRRELLSIASLLGKEIEVIDRGSPYANSLVLLDDWGETDTLYLSSGEFLEPTLLDGASPLVLIGQSGYSSGFIETLRTLGVKSVKVIGAELMSAARKIRDDSNKEISVVVKYGETYTSAGYAGTVFALSTYRIPIPQPNVTITDILYDSETQKVYVKYSNLGDGGAYVAAITRILREGETLTTITDDEVFLMWPGDELVRTYSIDLSAYGLNDLEGNVEAWYGRYTDFLVNTIDVTAPLRITKVDDATSVDMERATYDGTWLRVYVRNTGPVDAFISGEVTLVLDGDPEVYQLSGVRLSPGKTGILKLRIRMSESELDENDFVDVFLRYGESSDLQVNSLRRKIQLEILEVRLELIAMPLLALLLIILVVSIVSRVRRRRYYRAGRRLRRVKTTVLGTKRRRRRPRTRPRLRY